MISVALAAFNGEPYIRHQISSILSSLRTQDELVVSDDGSIDGTVAVAESFQSFDPRVIVVRGPGRGVMANVENAMRACAGDVICLSDQDDVWFPEKAEVLRRAFAADPSVTCVIHDLEVTDGELRRLHPSYFALRKSGPGLVRNLFKNSYVGAAMAVRSSFLPRILPIPIGATMHDQWIGLNSELFGRSLFIPEVLARYRRHDSNLTELASHRPISVMAVERLRMVRLLARQRVRAL